MNGTMSPHRFSFHRIPHHLFAASFTAPREEKLSLLQASFLNAKLGIKTTGRAGKAVRCNPASASTQYVHAKQKKSFAWE
jgi:hypothetical protein